MKIDKIIAEILKSVSNSDINVFIDYGDNDYRSPHVCLRVSFYIKTVGEYNKPEYTAIEFDYNHITDEIFKKVNDFDFSLVDKKYNFKFPVYNGNSFSSIWIGDNKIKVK